MTQSATESILGTVVDKLESFAHSSLTAEEKDALAAILQLAVVGARQTPDLSSETTLLINHHEASVAEMKSLLAELPSRLSAR